MTKESERKKIVEAMSTATTVEEMKEVLKDAGFEFKAEESESKTKKKANI